MRNPLTYGGPVDRPSLLNIFWPDKRMILAPEDMCNSLEYVERMGRTKEYVDSEVGPVRVLKFNCNLQGKYYSDGQNFYKEN